MRSCFPRRGPLGELLRWGFRKHQQNHLLWPVPFTLIGKLETRSYFCPDTARELSSLWAQRVFSDSEGPALGCSGRLGRLPDAGHAWACGGLLCGLLVTVPPGGRADARWTVQPDPSKGRGPDLASALPRPLGSAVLAPRWPRCTGGMVARTAGVQTSHSARCQGCGPPGIQDVLSHQPIFWGFIWRTGTQVVQVRPELGPGGVGTGWCRGGTWRSAAHFVLPRGLGVLRESVSDFLLPTGV